MGPGSVFEEAASRQRQTEHCHMGNAGSVSASPAFEVCKSIGHPRPQAHKSEVLAERPAVLALELGTTRLFEDDLVWGILQHISCQLSAVKTGSGLALVSDLGLASSFGEICSQRRSRALCAFDVHQLPNDVVLLHSGKRSPDIVHECWHICQLGSEVCNLLTL